MLHARTAQVHTGRVRVVGAVGIIALNPLPAEYIDFAAIAAARRRAAVGCLGCEPRVARKLASAACRLYLVRKMAALEKFHQIAGFILIGEAHPAA